MTLFGVQRGVFLAACGAWVLVTSAVHIVAGIVTALIVYGVGHLALAYDPRLAWMIWHAGRLRSRYDPLKHDPVVVEIVE